MTLPAVETVRRVGGGLCGCLLDSSVEDFAGLLNHPGIDLVEWRIDRFAERYSKDGLTPFFERLSSASPRHSVIATNRPVREMGAFDGPEDLRLKLLEKAAASGAEWVDVELGAPDAVISAFSGKGAKVLLSHHLQSETPSGKELRALLEKMSKTGADALKIVTFARADEDNLRVLELIPLARNEFSTSLVAFCMGPAGKWSRIASLLLGSPWTYAQLPGQPAAAPGQMSPEEIRIVLDIVERV